MLSRRVFLFVLPALLAWPTPAQAFKVAIDPNTADELRWDTSAPLEYRMHQDFGGDLPPLRVQGAVRQSFETWTSLPSSDVDIEEQTIFRGAACPHAMPKLPEEQVQAICGGPLPEVDGESVIFWIETLWPFGNVVIGLTTLTWAEGGRLVDADIALNGVDYVWSMGDTDVHTDLQTILVHEIGHYFGLDHSEVPGAVMGVDYQQETRVHTLQQDDIDGLAYLYPCASGSCSSQVSFEPPSCSLGSGVGPLAALLGLLVFGALLRGRGRALAPLLALVLLPATADTSVVMQLDAIDLAERSDAVVRARVVDLQSELRGVVWTDVSLAVTEVLSGEAPDRITLSQPGGVAGGFGTKVFGMPDFVVDEDVVLFLEFSEFGPRVVGLAQGKATVAADGSLGRDLSGLALARAAEVGPVRVAPLPPKLAPLRALLR